MHFDLSQRRCQPEIMDQPGLAEGAHAHALQGLARINWWSASAGILWPSLQALSRELAPQPLRVLDVATGAGDMPIRLWQMARRAGVALTMHGCDLSSTAIAHAQQRARAARADVHFFQADALTTALPGGYHAVTSSLFLHHLHEEQALTLLLAMRAATQQLVLINDLRRSWLGYWLAYVGTRLLSTSHVVHNDGPLSVEGAFTSAEALALAHRAGLLNATVKSCWPFRYLLTWRRSG